jgi:hypothetical protein
MFEAIIAGIMAPEDFDLQERWSCSFWAYRAFDIPVDSCYACVQS